MHKFKRWAIVAVVVVGVVPEGAHPGAEEPPILRELRFVESELRADIDDLERRLTGHTNNLHALAGKHLEDFIKKGRGQYSGRISCQSG